MAERVVTYLTQMASGCCAGLVEVHGHTTRSYVCVTCRQPCDVVPPPQAGGSNG